MFRFRSSKTRGQYEATSWPKVPTVQALETLKSTKYKAISGLGQVEVLTASRLLHEDKPKYGTCSVSLVWTSVVISSSFLDVYLTMCGIHGRDCGCHVRQCTLVVDDVSLMPAMSS